MANKTKAHIRYKNQSGEVVPGVTAIIGELNKPQLIIWSNRLGLQGIDSTKYRDEMGDIGTLAHAMILAELRGETLDTVDYSKEQIDKAENCYLSWLEWRKDKVIEPIAIEQPLISETIQCGGTMDFLGKVNGQIVLMDYKTGGIYKESYIQTCAYLEMAIECGFPAAEKIIILGIPRAETEQFQEVSHIHFDTGWEIFKHLRSIYGLLKNLK